MSGTREGPAPRLIQSMTYAENSSLTSPRHSLLAPPAWCCKDTRSRVRRDALAATMATSAIDDEALREWKKAREVERLNAQQKQESNETVRVTLSDASHERVGSAPPLWLAANLRSYRASRRAAQSVGASEDRTREVRCHSWLQTISALISGLATRSPTTSRSGQRCSNLSQKSLLKRTIGTPRCRTHT